MELGMIVDYTKQRSNVMGKDYRFNSKTHGVNEYGDNNVSRLEYVNSKLDAKLPLSLENGQNVDLSGLSTPSTSALLVPNITMSSNNCVNGSVENNRTSYINQKNHSGNLAKHKLNVSKKLSVETNSCALQPSTSQEIRVEAAISHKLGGNSQISHQVHESSLERKSSGTFSRQVPLSPVLLPTFTTVPVSSSVQPKNFNLFKGSSVSLSILDYEHLQKSNDHKCYHNRFDNTRFGNQNDQNDDQLCVASEQIINKALDLIQKPYMKADESSKQGTSSAKLTKITPVVRKECERRQTIQDHIENVRESVGLRYTIPELQNLNSSQIAVLLRKLAKTAPVREFISEELISNVLEGRKRKISSSDVEYEPGTKYSRQKESWCSRFMKDPNLTESSSEEEDEFMPSTSSTNPIYINPSLGTYRYYDEIVKFATRDTHISMKIDECEEAIERFKNRLAILEKSKGWMPNVETPCEETSAARCRPYNMERTRWRIIRNPNAGTQVESKNTWADSQTNSDRVRAYCDIDHRCTTVSDLSSISFERRVETYLRRKSNRPEICLRKKPDVNSWMSIEPEVKLVREAGGESFIKSRRKRSEAGSSRGGISVARRGRYKRDASPLKRARQKLVRRSLDQKRKVHEFPNRPKILLKYRDNNGKTSRSNLAITDEEFFFSRLPSKIDYKEIELPSCKYEPFDFASIELDHATIHQAHSTTLQEIAKRHLEYEAKEKQRFRQYRESKSKSRPKTSKGGGDIRGTKTATSSRTSSKLRPKSSVEELATTVSYSSSSASIFDPLANLTSDAAQAEEITSKEPLNPREEKYFSPSPGPSWKD